MSLRTEPMGQDAGLIIQQVIIPPGKAGGQGTTAGGQIPLVGQDVEQLLVLIERRFLDFMGEPGEGMALL